MMYVLQYSERAIKQLSKLDKGTQKLILTWIANNLENCEKFLFFTAESVLSLIILSNRTDFKYFKIDSIYHDALHLTV